MNNKGSSGLSGCSGHCDWTGYKRELKWDSETPDCLIKIMKFRNETIKKEWWGSIEHDVSGATVEEVNRKGKELQNRVQKKLDEIQKRYDDFDEAIDELMRGGFENWKRTKLIDGMLK